MSQQQLLLGYTNLGSGGSGTIQPVAYEFRLQSTLTTNSDGQSLIPAKVIADDQGNVYGVTKFEYFKVSKFGNLAWVKNIPSAYSSGNVSYGLDNIAISPNGGYLVICGDGGDAGYDSTAGSSGTGGTGEYYGSEIIASHINVNSGDPIKHYKVKDGTVPQEFRIGQAQEVVVDDDGICNVVGNLYRIFDDPYNEFCRLVIDLNAGTIITAVGDTNGRYMEGWKNVASNGSKIIMGGLDAQNVQAGFQTYNWSLFEYNTSTVEWTKTWQSNNGNGVMGEGVCITDDGVPRIFAGYRDVPLAHNGILEIDSTTGTPNQYTKIHFAVNDFDDVTFNHLTTDGTNIYFAANTYNTIFADKQIYIIGCIDIATKTSQWTNYITRTSSDSCVISRIRYNPGTDKLDISGNTTPANDGTHTAFILELPKDGSGTGKYGSYTYASTSLNASTATSSWYSGSPSFSTYSDTSTIAGDITLATDSTDIASWQLKSDYGHDEFIIPGTYNWKCPAGVTSVCVVAVGAGGSGTADGGPGGGGGGGGLGWKNNIAVTPGTSYTVVVGDKGNIGGNGGNSYFIDTNTVCGFGGSGNSNTGTGGNGGSYTGDGGGSGGNGGSVTNASSGYEAGGGGAGGYSGNGGNGGSGDGITTAANTGRGGDGSGGAGGGGGYGGTYTGGGVRLRGEGASGRGGVYQPADPNEPFGSGETGSYDQEYFIAGASEYAFKSQMYGGGGAGAESSRTGPSPSGIPGTGAVRIIWGAGRAYPSTNTDNEITDAGDGGGDEQLPPANDYGSQEFTSTGDHTWTAPTGVTSVCVVCIGGGGGGAGGYSGNGGGGGGALAYGNDIPVTPGTTYDLHVGIGGSAGFWATGHPNSPNDGTNGEASWFMTTGTLYAGGGIRGVNGGTAGGAGGTSSGTARTGGGDGGTGGNGSQAGSAYTWGNNPAPTPWSGGGGGGTGGYSGNGGDGGSSESNGSDGTGGAGGGGGASPGYFSGYAGNGGGVDIYGEGFSGNGGVHFAGNSSQNGVGGSGSTVDKKYGGGGRGGSFIRDPAAGYSGAVRIIWGTGRAFPNTNTEEPDTTTPPAGPVETESGDQEWTVPGLYKWECPPNVYNVSAVVVGGGAGGDGGNGRYSGGGGNLRYKNNISVTPGNLYSVFVGAGGFGGYGGYHNTTDWVDPNGASGSQSYFSSAGTCSADGGIRGGVATGGTGDGGGNGGSGYDVGTAGASNDGRGGGGAGGYSGNGGAGGNASSNGSAGTGGAGGGGAGGQGNSTTYTQTYAPGYGGGAELYGEGTSGSGGTISTNATSASGTRGSANNLPTGASAKAINVHGGGGYMGSKTTQSSSAVYGYGLGGAPGGDGGVRLIWGAGRSFPTTFAGDAYQYDWYYNVGEWVPEYGGYYAGLYTTKVESFANLDPAGTQYRLFIAEKSVSQSMGMYKNERSCDGSHTYSGTSPSGSTTAPNAQYDGYFNTYSSVLANASATTHPIFHAVQNLSITVDGTVFDDWYIPAAREAEFVYPNLKLSPSWQVGGENEDQAFDTTSPGSSSNAGELWLSSGDSCSNTGVLVTAAKFWPGQSAGGQLVWGYYKDDTALIRPIRRVAI